MSFHRPPVVRSVYRKPRKLCEKCNELTPNETSNSEGGLLSFSGSISKPKSTHENLELTGILTDEVTEEEESTDKTCLEAPERQQAYSSTPTGDRTYPYDIDFQGEGFYDDNGKFIRWEDMSQVPTPGWQSPSSGGFEDETVDPYAAPTSPYQGDDPPTPASFCSYESGCDRIDDEATSPCSPKHLSTHPETSAASNSSPLFEPLFEQITPEQRAYIEERRKALSRALHHYSPGRKELSILAGDDETDPSSPLSTASSRTKIPQKRRLHGAAKDLGFTSSSPSSSDNSDSFEIFPPTKRHRKDPPKTVSLSKLIPPIASSTASSLIGSPPISPPPNEPIPANPYSTTLLPTKQLSIKTPLSKPSPVKPSPVKSSQVKVSITKAISIKLIPENCPPKKAPIKNAPPLERKLSKLPGSQP